MQPTNVWFTNNNFTTDLGFTPYDDGLGSLALFSTGAWLRNASVNNRRISVYFDLGDGVYLDRVEVKWSIPSVGGGFNATFQARTYNTVVGVGGFGLNVHQIVSKTLTSGGGNSPYYYCALDGAKVRSIIFDIQEDAFNAMNLQAFTLCGRGNNPFVTTNTICPSPTSPLFPFEGC